MDNNNALEELNHITKIKNNMAQFEYTNKNLNLLYYVYFEKSKENAKEYVIDLINHYIKTNKIKINLNELISKIEDEIENLAETYELYLTYIFENIRISNDNQNINITKVVGYHENSLLDSSYNKKVVTCVQKMLDSSVIDIESRKKIFLICDDLFESIISIFKIEETGLSDYKKSFITDIKIKITSIFKSPESKKELIEQRLEQFKQKCQTKIAQIEDEICTYNAQMEILYNEINAVYLEQINS